jgi:hypothetical protein
MEKPSTLPQKAATLRERAARALRLSVGLPVADEARLVRFSEELGDQATELERQVAAETKESSRRLK